MDRSDRKGLLLVVAVTVLVLTVHVLLSIYTRPMTKTWSMPASATLDFAAPCAATVTITPAGPQADFTILATAKHHGEIENLASGPGTDGAAKIGHAADCPDQPTLTLAVRLPAGTAIQINDEADTDYSIGPGAGALTVLSAGNGDIHAGSVGNLTARLDGSGDLSADSAASADLNLSADGDVTIGRVSGNLRAVSSDDGDLKIDSVGGDATITMSGDGDVTISRLAGHLTQTHTGDGDLHVNGS